MSEITIYHDGKPTRDYKAKAIKVFAKRIFVEFTNFNDELITCWFYRRSKSGDFEARGWNYWILGQKDPFDN